MIWPDWRSVATLLALAASACSGSRGSVPCGPVVREQLDPQSFVHVLDPAGLEYLTDPPTSGPHVAGLTTTGVAGSPLARPAQVALLEQGIVLLQHRDLPGDDRARLEALAGDGVVVAPNPELPAAIVATAWLTKQRCDGFDRDALDEFIADHGSDGVADHQ